MIADNDFGTVSGISYDDLNDAAEPTAVTLQTYDVESKDTMYYENTRIGDGSVDSTFTITLAGNTFRLFSIGDVVFIELDLSLLSVNIDKSKVTKCSLDFEFNPKEFKKLTGVVQKVFLRGAVTDIRAFAVFEYLTTEAVKRLPQIVFKITYTYPSYGDYFYMLVYSLIALRQQVRPRPQLDFGHLYLERLFDEKEDFIDYDDFEIV